MEIKDTHPYVKAMEQIKRRVDTINACSDRRARLAGPPRVECAALQLRMVLELIALASLAANKELFQQQSMRFEKHWRPSEIIKDLEKLNPKFYPIPFRSSEPDDAGLRSHLPLSDGFLAKDELVAVHGRCGNVLHARNPFGKPIDYDGFLADIIAWTNKVTSLLNTHEIWLLGDDHFHVVNMTEQGNDAVRMYTFQRVDA
ncbi:MAG: hypothetical protein ACREBW_03005 [Candidatus Micrarchaeaceae archaeon]